MREPKESPAMIAIQSFAPALVLVVVDRGSSRVAS
jgi:hypothetical protein